MNSNKEYNSFILFCYEEKIKEYIKYFASECQNFETENNRTIYFCNSTSILANNKYEAFEKYYNHDSKKLLSKSKYNNTVATFNIYYGTKIKSENLSIYEYYTIKFLLEKKPLKIYYENFNFDEEIEKFKKYYTTIINENIKIFSNDL